MKLAEIAKNPPTLRPSGFLDSKESGTILVVDDIEGNRLVLHELLVAMGHKVDTANNGCEALRYLQRKQPDIVLLDIIMPEVDGRQVLQTMKADPSLCEIPVIVISAIDDITTVADAIQKGAEDYLTKPFNLTILAARIHSTLTRKRQRDAQKAQQDLLNQKHQALQESERSREALANMFVHDLNNPISSIQGYTYLAKLELETKEPDIDRFQNCLDQISTSTSDLRRLIDGLLITSKIQSGNLPVFPQKVDLVEQCIRVTRAFQGLAAAQQITLSLEIEAESGQIQGDLDLISRTLDNLVVNALKYGETEVILALRDHKERICLEITNDGAEIPDELLHRIFDPFVQFSDATGNEKRFGVGLGLTFCKLATELQGGTIEAKLASKDRLQFTIGFNKNAENSDR